MSETTTESTEFVEPSQTTESTLAKEYGFSVLLTGLARMWRGSIPAIVVVLLNAVAQTALLADDPVIGEGDIEVYVLALISGIAILLTSAILTATALESVPGRAKIGAVIRRTTGNFWFFSAWLVGLWVVTLIGYLLFLIPATIVLALTPFVAVAAMDGQGNALAADLKAISARPIRWAFTIIFTGIVGAVLWLLSAVNTFFIAGPISAFIAVSVVGLVGWWLLTSWACLYRSTPIGVVESADQDPPDQDAPEQ